MNAATSTYRNLLLFFYISFLVTAILLLASGPASAQSSLYDFREFTVTLEKYPPSGNPYTSAIITLDGRCVYMRKFQGKNYDVERKKEIRLSVEQLEYLYYQIMRSKFFEIGETFGNPDMKKGNIVRISVQFDNQIHTVTMYDERYLVVDNLARAIMKVLPDEYARTFEDDYDGSGDRFDIILE